MAIYLPFVNKSLSRASFDGPSLTCLTYRDRCRKVTRVVFCLCLGVPQHKSIHLITRLCSLQFPTSKSQCAEPSRYNPTNPNSLTTATQYPSTNLPENTSPATTAPTGTSYLELKFIAHSVCPRGTTKTTVTCSTWNFWWVLYHHDVVYASV